MEKDQILDDYLGYVWIMTWIFDILYYSEFHRCKKHEEVSRTDASMPGFQSISSSCRSGHSSSSSMVYSNNSSSIVFIYTIYS